MTVILVDASEEEENLVCGWGAVVAMEDGEKRVWGSGIGVCKCALEVRESRGVIGITDRLEFLWKVGDEEGERSVEGLEVLIHFCHGGGVGISQQAKAVSKRIRVDGFDGIAQLLEFAECGAVGGKSLEVIVGLGFVSDTGV